MSQKAIKANSRVIAYVSEDELIKLDELANAKRVSRSWIVREAVIRLITTEQNEFEQGVKP